MTVLQASKLWNVDPKEVRQFCVEGKIPGAYVETGEWIIPDDAEMPEIHLNDAQEPFWDEQSWGDLLSYLSQESGSGILSTEHALVRPSYYAEVKSILEKGELTFSETILALIDAKGLTDVAVYKRAGLDRRLFSKIRSKRNYSPSYKTAIRLCLALELSVNDTQSLLQKAGMGLFKTRTNDRVLAYCMSRGTYSIAKINEAMRRLELEEI